MLHRTYPWNNARKSQVPHLFNIIKRNNVRSDVQARKKAFAAAAEAALAEEDVEEKTAAEWGEEEVTAGAVCEEESVDEEEETTEDIASDSPRRRRKKGRRLSRHRERRGRFRRRCRRSWRGCGWRARRGGGVPRRLGRRGMPRRKCRQHRRGCGRVQGLIRGGATRVSKRSKTPTVLPGEERNVPKKSAAELYNEAFKETGQISGYTEEERKAHQEYLATRKEEKEALDKKNAEEKARKEAAAAAAVVSDRMVSRDNDKREDAETKAVNGTTAAASAPLSDRVVPRDTRKRKVSKLTRKPESSSQGPILHFSRLFLAHLYTITPSHVVKLQLPQADGTKKTREDQRSAVDASVTSAEAGDQGGPATSASPSNSIGEENAELCMKAGDDNKTTAKVRHERELFKDLFTKLTDKQRSLVEESMTKAAEKDGEKERVAKSDVRGMTFHQAEKAALKFKNKTFPSNLYSKCEKYDGRLYGIIVDGNGVKGTRVHVRRTARSGVVSNVAIGNDSNSLYTISWDDGSEDSVFNTPEVLLHAVDGQGVVSLEDDKLLFRRWLCSALTVAYTHGYLYVIQDRNKFKDPRPGVKLGDDDKARAKIIRKFVWDEVKGLKASDTVNAHEQRIISSDQNLVAELDEAGSFLKMLELDGEPTGLIREHGMSFDMEHQHMDFINYILRSLQESWKLGRWTSIASFLTPVAEGGDGVEFVRGLGSVSADRTEVKRSGEVVEKCGLGMKTVLAKSFHGKEGDDQRRYIWLKHVPLYVLGQLTRPEHLGSIRGNSEHTRYVSPTCKNLDFFKFATRFSSTAKEDHSIQEEIAECYSLVSAQKRDAKTDIENCDPQYGKGRKHYRARIDRDISAEERKQQIKLAIDIVQTNGIKPLLAHIQPEEVKNCWSILEANEKYWEAEDENHLKANWIDGVVDRLVSAGLTCRTVSLFSLAYAVIDHHTSSVKRTQCMLRCLARNSHVFEGLPRDVVDKDNKNYKKLSRSRKGYDIHHTKSKYTADIFVVLIVICRPLMRKLLQQRAAEREKELITLEAQPLGPRETLNGRRKRVEKLRKRVEEAKEKKLGETTGPFDENGRNLCEKAYGDLLQLVGVRCFGIPNYRAHIARTEHITTVHGDAVRKGMSVDHPDVTQIGWLAGHGEESQYRFYDDERNRNGSEFVQAHCGFLQSLETVTAKPGGMPPPSTELSTPPGESSYVLCFYDTRLCLKFKKKSPNNFRMYIATTEPTSSCDL